MKKKIKLSALSLMLLFSAQGFAFDDPAEGKPFFPWTWEEHLKPTLQKSYDQTGLTIVGASAVSTLALHQYDGKMYDFSKNGGNLWMNEDTASKFGKLGNGVVALAITGTQFIFDHPNGLRTARALLLTTVSHLALSAMVRRKRPNNKSDYLPWPSSFPSGHSSSAFVMAGSLAYSYGWKAGVPSYLAASAIALSRIKENRHWASDIVGGAFLGTFWARASFSADQRDKEAFLILPMPVYDGAMISAIKDF